MRTNDLRLLFVVGPLLTSAIALNGAGCIHRSFPVELSVPRETDALAQWYEVAAFPGNTCPRPEALGNGTPTGSSIRAAFTKGRQPDLGSLGTGSYAVTAVAKSNDCTVIAGGCTVMDASSAKSVEIVLSDISNGRGCASGSVCQAAQCVPPTDPNNPAIGLNCSLAVTGAGPLGNPTGAPSQSDQVVSYPSIAAIPGGGFAIAYREVAQGGILSRFTSFPIDKNGGAYPIQIFGLDNCGVLDDGVGLAFGPSGAGLSAYAKPCISTQETETIPNGVVFTTFDRETKKTAINLAACKGCADPLKVQISNRSVVWSEARKSFLAVLTQEGQATLSERLPEGSGTKEGVVLPFGGAAKDHTSASIAISPGSTELVGLLASSRVPFSNDDSGTPVGTLYANLVNATQLSSIGSAYRLPGSWGSVAVAGTRLLVVAGDGEGGITVRALDPDVSSPDRLRQTFIDTEALGNVAGSVVRAEIAVLGDRFFVAIEIESVERGKRTGDIVVAAYDHALPPKTPIRFREVRFSRDPRVPSVERIRDGRLAVTAADNRVAVVWATGRELTSNDRVGGYATLACD